MDRIIEINDVSFSYEKRTKAITSLSLGIKRGKTIGLIGSNGAGKSTLLKLLVGLETPNKGSIIVDGIENNRQTLNLLRQKVGYAFQDAQSQLFMTTVYEDVAFGPRNKGCSASEIDEIVRSSLEAVDAYHLKERPPYKLSGGEKKRVALATVLSLSPEIIILDEPTTGLDPKSRRTLITILKSLKETKIIATHDMDMALMICDEVIVLHEGKLVTSGAPKEIFSNKSLLDMCDLEVPLILQNCPVCHTSKR